MIGRNINILFILLSCGLFLALSSCQKEPDFSKDAKLSFSTDTVFFDTVFVTVGSTTKNFKVYNRTNKHIKINKIELGKLTKSNFRINVNGRAGVSMKDFVIEPGDSLFVFVEVTIDPNDSQLDVLAKDSILFYTGNHLQTIKLIAPGKNAYFHYPRFPATKNFPAYSLESGIWKNDKPHVVYGIVIVPTNETLIIEKGTKVYMHNNANIIVANGASLQILGSPTQKVIIQGDRLDNYYRDQPGTWGRIWLTAGSINNIITHAIIKNGRVGVHVDTLASLDTPTLEISNTIIQNMSAAALFAQGSWVEAYNCVFSNCGEFAVLLNIGGKYRFRHCTIANYWRYSNRKNASLAINNFYKDIYGNYQIRPIEQAYFGNCIIWGNKDDEILLEKYPYGNSIFNVKFENCLIKIKENYNNYQAEFINCQANKEPNFEKVDSLYFNLKANSPAIDVGNEKITEGIDFDIENKKRIMGLAPDLGAYEKK